MRSKVSKVSRASALLVGACSLAVATDAEAGGPAFALQGTFAGGSQAFFGISVAIDGDTAVVGAENDNGKGAAYVFVRSGSTWSQQAQLVASDGASGDLFGSSVAISGNVVLIGADNKASGQGYLYSFARTGTSWTQQAEFTSPDGAANDCFGCALALSGSTALVGAPQRLGGTGGAYVFALSGTTWAQQREWVGATSGDAFGVSVALTPDAATAVVGAHGVSAQAGAAYVFTRNGSWSTVPSQFLLTAAGGQAGDQFGYSVGAAPGTVLVGAYNQNAARGAAYVFTGGGTSWSQQTLLTASDGVSANGSFGGDHFAGSVALSGGTAVVGAPQKAGTAGNGPGAVYFFTNTGGSAWVQSEVLAPGSSQFFGRAVAVSGTTAAVGASSTISAPSAAYVYAASSSAAAPALDAFRVWGLALLLAAAGAFGVGRARRRGVTAT